jgi:hypothetical protein
MYKAMLQQLLQMLSNKRALLMLFATVAQTMKRFSTYHQSFQAFGFLGSVFNLRLVSRNQGTSTSHPAQPALMPVLELSDRC